MRILLATSRGGPHQEYAGTALEKNDDQGTCNAGGQVVKVLIWTHI